MKITSYTHKLKSQTGQTIKLATIAFSVISLILISISLFSFFGAQRVEKEYNVLVDDSIEKLRLVHDLHKNEESIYQAITTHLNSKELALKEQLEERISRSNILNNADTEQLIKMLQDDAKKSLFWNYIKYRQTYHNQLDHLLTLSRQNKTTEANEYYTKHMLPAFTLHQEYLDLLSEAIEQKALNHGNTALASIKTSIDKFNILLLLGFGGILISGLLIKKFITQLKKDNQLLHAEIEERQQLEDALEQNQKQYKALFNSNPIPMWVYDQNSLSILEVNAAANQEYGYTKEEFNNISLTDLLPENDRFIFF